MFDHLGFFDFNFNVKWSRLQASRQSSTASFRRMHCMLLFTLLLFVTRTDSHPGSRDLEAKDQRGVTCLGRIGFVCPELKSALS